MFNPILSDLSSLDALADIGGGLSILLNNGLSSLSGLDNLNPGSITNLSIYHNPLLATCEIESICNYLASPNGTIDIYNNAPGCNNPPEVAAGCGITLPCLPYGNYHFSTQAEIDNFPSGYPGCTTLWGDVVIIGNDIINLDSLNIITSIEGSLTIGDVYYGGNPGLTSITGLNNLTSIGSDLSFYGNASLTSLTGLDNIDAGSIANLSLYSNILLSTCAVQSICDYLAANNGVEIHDNATGCNSEEEVDTACVYLSNGNAYDLPAFTIYPNPTSTTITISTPTTPNKNTILTIFNINGQALLSRQITEQQTVVDVAGLVSGVYFVKVANDRTVCVEKIIRQ